MVARKPASPRSSLGPARAPIERVQDTLPGPLRAVPVQALLAAGGLAIIAALVLSAALLRGDKAIEALEEDTLPAPAAPAAAATVGAAPGASSAASDVRRAPAASELDAARLGGAGALRSLAQRFPEDPGVLQALAIAEARDATSDERAAAVDVLRHLLEIAPGRRADKDVQAVLMELASGPADRAPEALALLETRMGAYGPDMLYELRERAASSKATKDRAAESLAKPEVLKLASKALRVAEELRARPGCNRKELIPRVAADGDHRALPFLKPLLAQNCGGGFPFFKSTECFACFSATDRKDIAAAIAAIEKRDGGPR